MKKRKVFLISSLTFSMGIIVGFLISPVKQGIYNYAGNNTSHNYGQNHSKGDEEARGQSLTEI